MGYLTPLLIIGALSTLASATTTQSIIVPPERVCRSGIYIVRTLFYKDFIPTPKGIQVFLHDNASNTEVLLDVQDGCSNQTLGGFNTVTQFKPTGLVGAQCYADGIRIWYKIKADKMLKLLDTIPIKNMEVPSKYNWTDVSVYGLRLSGANAPVQQLDYKLNDKPMDKNTCYEIQGDNGAGTSYCYRASLKDGNPRECKIANEECSSEDGRPFKCQCKAGYGWASRSDNPRKFKKECLDINECLMGTDSCDLSTTDCINTEGSFWCKPKPATTSIPRAQCPKGELDIGDASAVTCVSKDVITPPHTVCGIGNNDFKYVTTFIHPFRNIPHSGRMAGRKIKVNIRGYFTDSVTRKRTWVDTTHNLECSKRRSPFLRINQNTSRHSIGPYKKKAVLSPSISSTNTLLRLISMRPANMLSQIGAYCFANTLMVWQTDNSRISSISVEVINPTDKGMFVWDVSRIHIPFRKIDKRRNHAASNMMRCTRYDVADECFWQASPNDHCSKHQSTCVVKSTGYPHHVGCQCNAGFVSSSGQCKENILCSPGLVEDTYQCTDINECAGLNECPRGSVCVNTYAGYSCQDPADCGEGRVFSSAKNMCEDVDECKLGKDTCDNSTTNCKNLDGSYECVCMNPDFVRTVSARACRPPTYEYRLLDPSTVRCCSHRGSGSVYLVRAAVTAEGEITTIEPVGCLHLTTIPPSRLPQTHKLIMPYVASGGVSRRLETEALLDFLSFYRVDSGQQQHQNSNAVPDIAAQIDYSNGCSHTFSFQNPNSTQQPPLLHFYITKPSKRYYDVSKVAPGNCVHPLGTNLAWLELKMSPRPQKRPSTPCLVDLNNGGAGVGGTKKTACAITQVFLVLTGLISLTL